MQRLALYKGVPALCRIHPHVFSFALKKSPGPDFKKQLSSRLKGVGNTKTVAFQIEEYAALLMQSRAELLTKIEASPASNIEGEVNSSLQARLPHLSVIPEE